ncbi:MAG: translation initiation factor IF-3 [Candidatus Saccharibacteria bacterium]|nr:translation initiation factor IF-3 [Candidatus Saccharibacteria bacterium]
MNQEIKADELRVIGVDGDQLGVMSLSEALKIAEEAGVDLIEISPNSNPPVAKVVDWGKYQYQKMKEQQKNRKHAKAAELKQMRMGLKIGSNDLDIKIRKIREFLGGGHKVKILIFFRGREMAHQELGYEMIKRIIAQLEEDAIVEQSPQMAGRNLSIVIRSK